MSMSMIDYFAELYNREAETIEKLQKIRNAISAGQEICEHDYVLKGNDSHYDYFVCKICGHQNKV